VDAATERRLALLSSAPLRIVSRTVTSGYIVAATAIVAAYLLGTVPGAQLIARRSGHDPTRDGSGNPGATNVYRLAGRRAGVLVLLIDLGKGIAATLGGGLVGGRSLALAAGAAAVLGHVAPVTRRFRGGKGVATAGGMALVLWPVASLALIAVFAALFLVVRIASVGSLAMAVGLPAAVAIAGRPAIEVLVAAVVAALVVARHHENIRRLLGGSEPATSGAAPERPSGTAT
jgi:acyl phosphate:glycerol-3-phosphate acyltransferase